MYNDLITVGGIAIHTYGVCIAIGIVTAFYVLVHRLNKYEQDSTRAIDMMLVALIPGFIGAKLNYIAVNIGIYPLNELLSITNHGFVIYGGVLFGMIGVFLYLKINKLAIAEYMDTGIASVALAQGFGRIGCFMAGCCFGIRYSGPLSVSFPHSEYISAEYELFPTQLLFALADFINFGILCISKKHNKLQGGTMMLYMITYGIGRFALEFLRGDTVRGTVFGMSTAQFTSICMTILGCITYGYLTRKKEKNNATVE